MKNSYIVLEVSNATVASPAQKSAYLAGLVTVVNCQHVKPTTTVVDPRFWLPTDSAETILPLVHGKIFFLCHVVGVFQVLAAHRVFDADSTVYFKPARFAVAMSPIFAGKEVEVGKWLTLAASAAYFAFTKGRAKQIGRGVDRIVLHWEPLIPGAMGACRTTGRASIYHIPHWQIGE